MARPKKIINWDEVSKLAECGCNGEAIAGYIGVSYDTLSNHFKKKFKGYSGLSEFIQEKKSRGDALIQAKIFARFMEGSPISKRENYDPAIHTLGIFLLKSRCGYTDKPSKEEKIQATKINFGVNANPLTEDDE